MTRVLTFETLYKVLRYGGMAGGKGQEQMSRHQSPRQRDNVVYWKTKGKINNDLK